MPKRTFQPKKVKIRKIGFRARRGSNILKRRRAKGRASLTSSDKSISDKNKRLSRRR